MILLEECFFSDLGTKSMYMYIVEYLANEVLLRSYFYLKFTLFWITWLMAHVIISHSEWFNVYEPPTFKIYTYINILEEINE